MRNLKVSFMKYGLTLIVALAGGTSAELALAQLTVNGPATIATKAETAIDYKIQAQPLALALRQFAEVTGLQLVYDAKITTGKQSNEVMGRMTANAALAKLVAGSDLSFTFSSNGPVFLAPGTTAGSRALGILRVDGGNTIGSKATVANGVNGSRDVQATEGTGSYTTNATSIATKSVETLKDTPFAVSVITRQRLDDQAINNFYSAMDQMTGVSTIYGSSNLDREIYSRGFKVDSYSVDGGSPLLSSKYNIRPLIDLSAYDSMQLQRGAAGLFNGYGDPGGIVNLVRKKPLDHNQVQLEAQAGSWQTYRTSLDATGPIALDGKVRGRVVVTEQSNHYFFDVAKDRSSLLYVNLEADLTQSTRLSGGLNASRVNSVPFTNGLPRYANGDDLNLPTSTCLCFPWSHSNSTTTEWFSQLDQKFGPDWSLTAHLTRNRQQIDSKVGSIVGPVNNVTKAPRGGGYTGTSPIRVDQTSADATVNGSFDLFGKRQEVVLGANWQRVDASGTQGVQAPTFGPFDLLHFDPNGPAASVEPATQPPSAIFDPFGQRQWGAYVNVNLNPIEHLHVLTGVRYTEYAGSTKTVQLCQSVLVVTGLINCPVIGQPSIILGKPRVSESNDSGHNLSKPNLSLSYDVARDVSVFGTYASIYRAQGFDLTKEGKPLAPVTGRNLELGVKWATPEKDLNASLTAYSILQNNVAVRDQSVPGTSAGGLTCCFLDGGPVKSESKGVDAELTGQLRKNWQMSFGYTYSLTNFVNPLQFNDGTPLQSQAPKHLVKLFTSYRFEQGDWLKRLTVGGGVNWQSRAFSSGVSCLQLDTRTGACLDGQSVPFDFAVNSYALVQAFFDYRLDDTWRVSLNGTNLTNHRGYQTINGTTVGGNWYVQPATYMVTLRGKW